MARLDRDTALRLSEPIEDVYLECIDRLIVNIAKHLGTGKAFRTADWETRKLAELGQLTAENAKIINEATKRVPMEIRLALEESSRIALEDLERLIERAIKDGALEKVPTDGTIQVLQELMERAINEANLTNTMMLESSRAAYLKAVSDTVYWQEFAYGTIQVLQELMERAINEANLTNTMMLESSRAAYLKAVSDTVYWQEFAYGELGRRSVLDSINQGAVAVIVGTETRTQALKKAIAQLAERGIYGFIDRRGRHWSPEAYMGMCIRTASHNAAIDSIRARQEDYKSDVFQVSQHPAARPLCYPYQGKFYSWNDASGTFTDGNGVSHEYKPLSSTSYGQPAGLFGINCGHYPLAQIPNVTIPQDKPEEDKEENDRQYKESQQQRAIERAIRNAKRKEAAFRRAGLDDAADEQISAIRHQQERMREFLKVTGRKRRYDREQIR